MQISLRQLSALILWEVLVVNRGRMEERQRAWFQMRVLATGNSLRSVSGSACIIEAFVARKDSEWE